MAADTQSSAKEMILASKKAAAEHIANIRNAPELTRDLVRQEVRAYIMAKFHLTDEDCTTDNFSRLAQISLSKSMKISHELVKEFDLAAYTEGDSTEISTEQLAGGWETAEDRSSVVIPKEAEHFPHDFNLFSRHPNSPP